MTASERSSRLKALYEAAAPAEDVRYTNEPREGENPLSSSVVPVWKSSAKPSPKSKQICVRVTEEMYSRIASAANRGGYASMTALIEDVFEKAFPEA